MPPRIKVRVSGKLKPYSADIQTHPAGSQDEVFIQERLSETEFKKIYAFFEKHKSNFHQQLQKKRSTTI